MRGNESSPHRRLFLYVCNAPNPCGIRSPRRTASAPPNPCGIRSPRRTASAPPNPCGTAPAPANRGEPRPVIHPSSGRHECRPYVGGLRKTRRGATCDARCRNGTTKRPQTEFRPPRRTPRHPARHPGDMNVAPTVAKRIRRGKRRGATCDARCRNGTMESAANGIPSATGVPPGPVVVYFCK